MKIHRVAVTLEVETVLSAESVSGKITAALAHEGVELLQIQTNVIQEHKPTPEPVKEPEQDEAGVSNKLRKKGWLRG